MNIFKFAKEESSTFLSIKSKLLYILLLLPLCYTVLLGLVYSKNVMSELPTVIYDQDNSLASRTLINMFDDSDKYQVVAQVQSTEELESLLKNETAMVGVVIPPNFAKDIKLSLGTDVLITVNASNIMYNNVMMSSCQEIIQTFVAGTGEKILEAGNKLPTQALATVMPINIKVRIINNPVTGYNEFMLGGLGINGLQIAILLVVITALNKEYNKKIIIGVKKSLAMVCGKLIPYWVVANFSFLLVVLAVNNIFAVPWRGNFLETLILGSAFSFLLIAICFVFSALFPDPVQAIQMPLLYLMPGLLYSGLSWPDFAMSSLGQAISAVMPLKYVCVSLRDLLLLGYSPTLNSDVLTMFGMGSFLLIIAGVIFYLRNKAVTKEVSL